MRVKGAFALVPLLLSAEVAYAQAQPYPPPQQPVPYPYPPQPPPPQPGYPPQQPAPQQPVPYPPPQQPAPQPPPQPGYPPPPQPGYPPQPAPPPPQPSYPPPGYGQYPSAPNYALPPEPETRLRRRGFAIGVAVGGGNVRFDRGGQNGLALAFDIGATLNQRMALMFDYSSVTYGVPDGNESHWVLGGVAQLFFARFLWAKAGLGMGRLSLEDLGGTRIDATERSLAVLLGFGAEVVQTAAGFALDLQLRFAGSSYRDAGTTTNTALLVGFNFY
jgi:hypothetical protein